MLRRGCRAHVEKDGLFFCSIDIYNRLSIAIGELKTTPERERAIAGVALSPSKRVVGGEANEGENIRDIRDGTGDNRSHRCRYCVNEIEK